MVSIGSLLASLDERTIAQRVGIPHDEARMRFPLQSNTVGDFDAFSNIIADYYNYHFTQCVSNGGSLSRAEAAGRAKELLEQEYRRRNGDIVSAYMDGHEGTNGGMRAVLDTIAEGLKAESVKRYTREVFDRNVAPNSWEDKVEITKQFIRRCGVDLSTSIRANQPERYAQNINELVTSFVEALRRTSSVFRRL